MDGQVSLEEFIEYYKNISVSIDNDDYFTLMMNNSWNLRGDASPYQKYEKGWANEDASAGVPQRPKVTYRQPQQKVQQSGMMSNGNPLATTGAYYNERTNASRKTTTGANMHEGGNSKRQEQVREY